MSSATVQNLQIVSATYGGSDLTSFVQRQLSYFLDAHQNATYYFFTVGTEFFLADPNPNVLKMCVVVYRYLLEAPSTYSTFQTAFAPDGSTLTINPDNHTFETYGDPTPEPMHGYESIIAARWYWTDVTSQVQQQFQSLASRSPGGTPISVSSSAFGIDPAPGKPKQLTVVYGRYINRRWYFCTKVDLNSATSWTLVIPPATPTLQDRRLDIYSATWGGQDYTDYVRNRYMTDIIVNKPPTSVSNTWSFTPNNTFFGPDPNPGNQKMFVLVYRVARFMGVQEGQLTNPTAPPVWTQAWYDTKPPLIDIPNYPILGDVSGFRYVSAREDTSLLVDLSQADMTPLDKPNSWKPWIVQAVYSSVDVTANLVDQVAQQTAHALDPADPANTARYSITVSTEAFGDPWPGVEKQLTLTVGYPTRDEVGYEIQTFVQVGRGSPWIFELPAYMPPRALQWPQPFHPPMYRHVTFVNHGLAVAWPQVWQNGKVIWCPRPSNTKIWLEGDSGPFALSSLESVSVDLIKDAGCKEGGKYQLNFNCLSIEDSPRSSEFYVSANQTVTMDFTYHIDKKVVMTAYYIGQNLKYLVQFIGLVIEGME